MNDAPADLAPNRNQQQGRADVANQNEGIRVGKAENVTRNAAGGRTDPMFDQRGAGRRRVIPTAAPEGGSLADPSVRRRDPIQGELLAVLGPGVMPEDFDPDGDLVAQLVPQNALTLRDRDEILAMTQAGVRKDGRLFPTGRPIKVEHVRSIYRLGTGDEAEYVAEFTSGLLAHLIVARQAPTEPIAAPEATAKGKRGKGEAKAADEGEGKAAESGDEGAAG